MNSISILKLYKVEKKRSYMVVLLGLGWKAPEMASLKPSESLNRNTTFEPTFIFFLLFLQTKLRGSGNCKFAIYTRSRATSFLDFIWFFLFVKRI